MNPTSHSQRSSAPRRGVNVDVLAWGEIELGHFRCEPESPAWREDNQISEGTLLVVPHRAVEIAQAGADTVIASPAQAVFYRQRQVYRRRLIDPRGDDCVYVRLPDATWSRLLGSLLPAHSSGQGEVFQPPFSSGPIQPSIYLHFERLVHELERGVILDRLEFEERLLTLVDRLLADAAEARALRRGQSRDHGQLGRAAQTFVAAHFREDWSLTALATTLDTSPAHLSRVFRRHAGTSIHQHRIRLRLAAAIERVADAQHSLTQIAVELGFASSSHFSDQFRKHLGLPPSALRGAGQAQRRALRASRNLKAPTTGPL